MRVGSTWALAVLVSTGAACGGIISSGDSGGHAGTGSSAAAGGAAGAESGGGSGGGLAGTASVLCGDTPCDTGSGAFCCAEGYVTVEGCAGGSGTSTCQPSGAAPCAKDAVTIKCDGPEDCAGAGMVCCGTFNHCSPTSPGYDVNVLYADLVCRKAQDCTGPSQVVLCDPTASNPCSAGGTCTSQSPSLPLEYQLCKT